MSHRMTSSEREAFLAGLHVGVIGVVDDGRALAVPIWYGYEPGGDVWILTLPSSLKRRALDATGRFSLCAQDENVPYKYVTVEGPVTAVEPTDEETAREMAYRYLGQEIGEMYLAAGREDAGTSRTYRMTPERWYTVDYGKDFA